MTAAAATFLTARWEYLAMLNYEINPAVLEPFVPRHTELDTFNGKYYASMVGFLFNETKVRGFGIPFHRNFEEINLRFYVRKQGPEGWRRGVVFIKEIVPRLAIATIARWFYNEKYVALKTRHALSSTPHGFNAQYEWKFRQQWQSLAVTTKGAAQLARPASLEEFITEHYWGYARQRNGGSKEYRVEHPSWNIWQTESAELRCDVEQLYGLPFCEALNHSPASAFLAEGSNVSVYPGVRI